MIRRFSTLAHSRSGVNRTLIRFDCEREAKEPATMTLGLDCPRDTRKRFAGGCESQAYAVGEQLMAPGTLEELREQPFAPSPKRLRIECAGNWELRHTSYLIERPSQAPARR